MSKKIVIVGASRGIGEALVKRFSQLENTEVYALSRNIEKMQVAFTELENVTCFPLDLASNVQQQTTSIFNEIGTFDILINNAGYLVNKPFPEISHEDYTLSYQINVIGVMETVQGALIHLNKTSSHIVNISSMGGFQSSMKFPGLTAYSTSKAALCSFTELFSEEYKETSIAMNCLCLGSVQTEMLEEAFPGYIAPLKPEEISEYICDFSLNAHRFMKGKIIPLSLTNP